MIAFLHGKIVEKQPERLILDVRGVGYEIGIPLTTFEQLPETGREITIQTYHHITENDQMLFGFYQQSDKDLFQLLITVKNIGPKLGLAILSGMPAGEIINAISQHNISSLSSISGIGKKTAERMVLELKDKLDLLVDDFEYEEKASGNASPFREEALSALQSLGYHKKEAQNALKNALKSEKEVNSVTDLIKQALSEFNR